MRDASSLGWVLAAVLAATPSLAADRAAPRDRPPLPPPVARSLEADLPRLEALYRDLHARPELSGQEVETSARLARELRALGYEVTEHVGGHGLVAILANGPGPTLLVRTDLDALPIREETGLPFASAVTGRGEDGTPVGVMHACGHDLHMTVLVGTARALAEARGGWRGTLVLIGQPAEETLTGARAMIADGLFERFPRPDVLLALHVDGEAPAGTLSWAEGFATANSEGVDITVRGVAGHGALPDKAKDPIVLAAQIVLALQTVVSREVKPGQAAVVTVGRIQGGSRRNIIPPEVRLEATLRSYAPAVRDQLRAAVVRIAEGQARAAGLPDALLPVVEFEPASAPALWNDPPLARRIGGAFRAAFPAEQIGPEKPSMGGEDFACLQQALPRAAAFFFWLGVQDPAAWAAAAAEGRSLPAQHTPRFAPAATPSIRRGVEAMTTAALEVLGRHPR